MGGTLKSPLHRLLIACLLGLLAGPAGLLADGNYGSAATSGTSFKLGLGARPAAMGGAYLALAKGADSLYWNPAGLTQLRDIQASFDHLSWFQGVNDEAVQYGQPLYNLNSAFGLGLSYLYATDISRDNWGNPGPSFTDFDFSAQAAYAMSVTDDLSLGMTYKIIRQGYASAFSMGSGFDFGMQYLHFLNQPLRLGLGMFNVGTPLSLGSSLALLPWTLKGGLAWTPAPRLNLEADYSYQPLDYFSEVSVGGEYTWRADPFLATLRAGYLIGPQNALGLLAGASVGLGLGWHSYQLDYALVPYGDLGLTHRITLTYTFGSD